MQQTYLFICSFIQQIFVEHLQRACTKKGNKWKETKSELEKP